MTPKVSVIAEYVKTISFLAVLSDTSNTSRIQNPVKIKLRTHFEDKSTGGPV